MRFLAIFLSLVHRINFKLHILIILNDLDKLAFISPILDHSKVTKISFWMIQGAKKVVFGHFLELRASDRLQTAYYDYTKWSWQVGSHITHAGSFKNHKNAFLDDQKSQKLGFWPFSGVWSVGSTWHCILWKEYMLSTLFCITGSRTIV